MPDFSGVRPDLTSWFHYLDVRRSGAIWGGSPSGLGYSDIAMCSLIGSALEQTSRKTGPDAPYWVLDLGTYFGHSAFCVGFGAAKISKTPFLHVLSIDIYEQPQWMIDHDPAVRKFIQTYGSTGPDAISKRLGIAFREAGLAQNPVSLLQRDVLTLTSEDLLALSPKGYQLIMVDCGKTPELMNRIGEFLIDSRVCPAGTIALFQDLFDWHAPWNAYALWRLLKEGSFSLYRAGKGVTPFARKLSSRPVGVICDQIKESPIVKENWCTAFTSPENEILALNELIQMFERWGYVGLAFKVACLKVGALLRAQRLEDAEIMIHQLDELWPAQLADNALQNAYCRLRHMQTGHKDLTLVYDTAAHRARNTFVWREVRKAATRLSYLNTIHPEEIPHAVEVRYGLDLRSGARAPSQLKGESSS